MLPIRVPDAFRIIAHRGASAYAPENTEAAFRLAVDMMEVINLIHQVLASDCDGMTLNWPDWLCHQA